MVRIRIAAALPALLSLLVSTSVLGEGHPTARYLTPAAYPEQDAVAVWRSLGASYVRKAVKDNQLDRDPALNARLDRVMAAIGAAAGQANPGFRGAAWRALLIDDFGHGAVAFPGGTVLVDAGFVRRLQLTDEELALLLAHEVAHIMAGHPSEKLSFMAHRLGKDRAPTAGSALQAFYTHDGYARQFQPTARLQEREADAIGAALLARSGYDAQRALNVFDKLAQIENGTFVEDATHDPATTRKKAISEVLRASMGLLPVSN